MEDEPQRIFEAICLFEVKSGRVCYLIDYTPKAFDIADVISVTTLSAIPKENFSSYSVHCFNVDRVLGYVLSFKTIHSTYSIVILSKLRLPYVFLKWLTDFGESIQDKSKEVEPIELFSTIYSLLRQWKILENHKLCLKTSEGSKIIDISIKLKAFLNFSPFSLLPHKTDFKKVWEDLLTGRGVLITGNDPDRVSNAALSVLSLAAPFIFEDKFIIAPNPNDSRLEKVSSEVFLVATTSTKQSIGSRQYGSKIRLTDAISRPSIEYCEECRDQGDFLLSVMKHILSVQAQKNPYNALLFKDSVSNYYETFIRRTAKSCLSVQDAVLFEKSNTFRIWQRDNIKEVDLRNGLLSNSPEELFADISSEDLHNYLEIIECLRERFSRDEHVLSVIRNHKKRISRLIRLRATQ